MALQPPVSRHFVPNTGMISTVEEMFRAHVMGCRFEIATTGCRKHWKTYGKVLDEYSTTPLDTATTMQGLACRRCRYRRGGVWRLVPARRFGEVIYGQFLENLYIDISYKV